jgi:hypothetical protein
LLVARRIRNHEAAPLGVEEPIRHVDSDTLLTLGLQAVDEQRQIEALALRAIAGRFAFERVQLIIEDAL